jgi:hypothetical protein
VTWQGVEGVSAVVEQTIAVPESSRPRLQSTPCPSCSAPVEPADAFCPACGTPLGQGRGESPAAATPSVGFRCENCGAEVRCEPGTRTTACPFCAAPYVIELDQRSTGKQDPEFVLGFGVSPDRAEMIYRTWIGAGGWFRPGNLRLLVEASPLRGIYLPFWSFSVKADSTWSAEIGEYWYRTETYTETDSKGNVVTKTRQVRETEWWPLDGGHHAFHSFYLVSASKGLQQDVSEWVQPFELLALKRYTPRFLAGWLSEEYSVEKDAAYAISDQEFRRREHDAVAAFLPGDTHRGLRVATTFSKANSDLILLPIYLRSFRYGGKLYRVLINGQTGKVSGERPVSARRILAAVGLVLALIGVIALIVALVGGGR